MRFDGGPCRFVRTVLVLAVVALGCAGIATAEVPADWNLRELVPVLADPPLPTPEAFPVQLIEDDGTAEGAFGVSAVTSRPFLWFQVFDVPVSDLDLEEIWVLFPEDDEIDPGDPVQLVVYRDTDADPTTGAELLVAIDTTVQVADGGTFSVYPLGTPVEFRGSGQLLIGVVSRFVQSGVTPPTQPAALDTSSSAGRSWVATWVGDPPDPPLLPPDQNLFQVDLLQPGNWMIRGFGSVTAATEIPTLGEVGIGVLVSLLMLAGLWRLARHG